jgi:hypothetical protein
MRTTYRSARLTYRALFGYSLVIIILLMIAVPVLAKATPASRLLDFSFSAETGQTPQAARPLIKGANLDQLYPGEERWYLYSRDTFKEQDLSWISLALRYESEAMIDSNQVNFDILAGEAVGGWLKETDPSGEVLGTGTPSPLKTTTPNLSETFWTGPVAEESHYYVRVFNRSPFSLDYALEAKGEEAAVSEVRGSLAAPANARQLAWTLTAQAVSNMTADQAARWMQQAQAIGWIVTEGTIPEEAPNPAEAHPHILWELTAEALAGQDAETAAQWLIQADSLGWLAIPLPTLKNPAIDVGPSKVDDGGGNDPVDPPAQPAPPAEPETYAPINIYPNNPLPFDTEHANSGRLAPYGEHWYKLRRDDLDEDLIEDMAMTMFFTPSQGFISNRINFEIFPAGQYHIWARGDANYMENLGAGMWVSRDEDAKTGERLWSGSLMDKDEYLIRVKNGSPEVVDYYLYPGDIENTELGNPTLHKAEAETGYMPYPIAPPTRAGSESAP